MKEVVVRQFTFSEEIEVSDSFLMINYLRFKDKSLSKIEKKIRQELNDLGCIFHNYYILNDKISSIQNFWSVTRTIEYACFKPNLNYDTLPLDSLNFIVDSVKNYSGIKHNIIEIPFLPPFDRNFYNSKPPLDETIECKKIVAKRKVFRLNDTEFFKYIILNPFE